MIELANVTLICLTGKDVMPHLEAIKKSVKEINFGDVKLIYQPTIKNINDWNRAIFYDLGDYVQTTHALLIHSNGYPVHSECWRDDWLQYDYAGSPFPLPTDSFSYRDINGKIQRVGNSVGLRSKKLMMLPKKLGIEWQAFHGWTNEDGAYSVNYRHIFEEHGCRFMPFEEALYFGREHELPENQAIEKTFLFHNYQGRNGMYRDILTS